ncbi:MAG: hypothetical protein QT11_C0001G0125 [archaeon GW2011_AR20]|nr:MAG: hypothetical protein QT11_C0001G0125 [archaeon GW2011_AR20]MBS3160699.1 Fic family protein [Candidatus Woesearchaeota archaeon]
MHILKRKKGNQEYFYLQHSFRNNGKVITKEIYLGKTIPKNIDKIKQKLEQENRKELYKKLEKIKENFQKEWKKIPNSVREKELQEIAIAFTYNTNAIEGSTITLSETRQIIKEIIAPNKDLRDIKETESHYKVFLEMLKKKESITNDLLLKWHKNIFGETKKEIAGKYREYLVRVGDYIAPDWQDVKNLMSNLVKSINKSKSNSVELAARAHYKFESIHPFGDGNGRIGRLLMNYILWYNKYPMMIIEYKKRQAYYKAFPRGEEYFVKYFVKLYLKVNNKRIG